MRPRDRLAPLVSTRGVAALVFLAHFLLSAVPTFGDSQPDLVHRAAFDSVDAAGRSTIALPGNSYRETAALFKVRNPPVPLTRPGLEKGLRSRFELREAEVETLFVVFDETLLPPQLPAPEPQSANFRPGSSRPREQLLNLFIAERRRTFLAGPRALLDRHHATVLRTFWLLPSATVVMRLADAERLAREPGVLSVTPHAVPAHLELPPHEDSTSVRVGRDRINSDGYAALGLPTGRIALLDGAVRMDHVVFDHDRHPIVRASNCVEDTLCERPQEPTDLIHGTASAAILVANNDSLPAAMGVTRSELESYCVYRHSPGGSEDAIEIVPDAVVSGLQAAVRSGDVVVVCQTQPYHPACWAIGQAAENAFRHGCVVVAANGNSGKASVDSQTVGYPASNALVMGVGGRSIRRRELGGQSWGMLDGSRIKPDLSAPTGCVTAWGRSPRSFSPFSATSGATPFAGGAALLLRSWLVWAAQTDVDPGQVYAQMLLSCDGVGPFDQPDPDGAGALRLPDHGWGTFGRIDLKPGRQQCDIPIEVDRDDLARIEAALWWPLERVSHQGTMTPVASELELDLVDPAGEVVSSSHTPGGVFERLVAKGPIARGKWILRVTAPALGPETQRAYWTAALRQ